MHHQLNLPSAEAAVLSDRWLRLLSTSYPASLRNTSKLGSRLRRQRRGIPCSQRCLSLFTVHTAWGNPTGDPRDVEIAVSHPSGIANVFHLDMHGLTSPTTSPHLPCTRSRACIYLPSMWQCLALGNPGMVCTCSYKGKTRKAYTARRTETATWPDDEPISALILLCF